MVAGAPFRLALGGNGDRDSSATGEIDNREGAAEVKGRLRVFDALSSCLGAERADISYSSIAATLGIDETTVKKLLHRLRQRYRELLRGEVADTVADPAEIDDEIRHLCAALAAGGA